ncbi:MAG: hypothetical protein R8F63_20170 [Acidimicrobiales bacterium]|nr:hypothetical protein [Acidimicrobiales bacterium]
MRVGARGFPLLIAVLLVAVGPANAADEGEVGVVDNVVQVIAVATVEGVSWGSDDSCTYEVVIDDDLAVGVYGIDLERLYSDTGRWLRLTCDGEVVVVDGRFVVPEVDAFTIPDLLEQAMRTLDPPSPTWRASPDGVTVPMVAQLPTWLWVDTAYWNGTFTARAATPSGRMWAEAHAVPAAATWSPGDGSTVVCSGPGSQWTAANEEPECSHTYRHSTAGTSGFRVTATVEFEVWGSTSLNPTAALLGTIARTAAPITVEVAEIQALETNGRLVEEQVDR